jgi:translocation and assembly module TamA
LKNSFSILLLLLLANLVFAQGRLYQIKLVNDPVNNLIVKTGEVDSAGLIIEAQKTKNILMSKGHLLANIDKLQFDADTMQAIINVGARYQWRSLGTNNIPEEMLSKAGYRERDFYGKEFSGKDFSSLVTKLLDQAANSGYPFANLQLQNIEIEKNSVKGVLNYEPGPVIYFDSLTINPKGLVKHEFLESYLKVKKGALFQLKHLTQIESSLNSLPYLKLKDAVQMSFQNNLCNLSFGLEPLKANKIDAIIGFLPNQKTGNGLLLTGYINLQLQNLFKSGKELSFIWRQFQEQSQKLFFLYKHPNIFNSPLGLSLNFDLLKQDSSFLNTNLTVQGFYQHKRTEISFVTAFKSSRSLSAPTDSLALPQITDFKIRQLGIRAAFNGLDDRLNPLKGTLVFIDFKVGNKQIIQNPNIAQEVYDSISLNPVQIEGLLGGEYNQKIAGPLVVHLDLTIGTIFNNDRLFTNDLMRLGGINSLRGFNDLELYVSSYSLARIEARLMLNQGSRLFVFFDQAWTRNRVADIVDQPYGFGAGMKLDTGKGDLQLVYALGVSAQQSLSLTQSKIHIGYVARF